MNAELPRGWAHTTIGDVADGMKNGLYKPASFYADSGVACLRMYNVDAGKIVWKNIKRMKLTRLEVEEYQLLPGDLLVNRVNSRELVGKTAIIPSDVEPCVFESKNIRLRLRRDLVCPEFVNYKLLLSGSRHFIHNAQQVVGMASISQPQIAAFDLPLPPLAEQRRIVAKLEKLFSQVGACKQRLARIPLLLKRFRQSVLAAACSGRLTADWRDTHKEVRPARVIVQSLKTPDPESQMDIFENSSDGDIPNTWSWVRLGKLGPLVGGGTPSTGNPRFWGGNIPWVSPKDMKRSRICDSEDHITDLGLKSSSVSKIDPGAILFVVRGMILIHTLPTAIADTVVTLNQDMKALVPEIKEMSEYLSLAARHVAPSILFKVKESTHGTRRIESSILKSWAIPLPPLEEQQEIVHRVENLFALADRLEARFTEGRKRVDSITQAILAKAFRGELVPTEYELAKAEGRSFESAEELLTRIGTASEVGRNGNGQRLSKRGRVEA
jgi:type I restriction enzyme, S subunit